GRLLLVELGSAPADAAEGGEDSAENGTEDGAEDIASTEQSTEPAPEPGTITELVRSRNDEVRGLAFSPDSGYLAWAQRGTSWGVSQIRLARLSDRTIVDVTATRFDDDCPVFTHDGKHLAFLSNRVFDTVYDDHVFDLGFLPGVRPYLVPLAETTPSPFAPELNGRPVTPEREKDKPKPSRGSAARAESGEVDGAQSASGSGSDSEASAEVDLEGIADRVVPFPVEAGRYRSLQAVKGGVVWMDYPNTGELHEAAIGASEEHPKPSLVRYDLEKRKRSMIVDELDGFAVSGDGARLAYLDSGDLRVKPSDAKDDDDAVTVDLDRVRVTV